MTSDLAQIPHELSLSYFGQTDIGCVTCFELCSKHSRGLSKLRYQRKNADANSKYQFKKCTIVFDLSISKTKCSHCPFFQIQIFPPIYHRSLQYPKKNDESMNRRELKQAGKGHKGLKTRSESTFKTVSFNFGVH